MACRCRQRARQGEVHGVHAFLVRIRHDDGTPCEGVHIEDDGHEPVVVVCQNGIQSAYAGAALKSLGYTNVSVLAGGLRAWQKARTSSRKPSMAADSTSTDACEVHALGSVTSGSQGS